MASRGVVTWYVCDIVTGEVLDELPLYVDSPGVTRLVAQETSQTINLPTAAKACPQNWTSTLVEGRTMIVLAIDGALVQGWTVDTVPAGSADVVPVACSGLETFLSRTNIPDYPAADDFTTDIGSTDLAQVAASLAAILVPRFGITIEWTPCGTVNADLPSYENSTDQTILDALTQLMKATGGPEWRIYPRWRDATRKQIVDKVVEIGPRIGMDRPDAVFELDADGKGNIDTYTRTASFAAGKGATRVIGVSDGSGAARPMTDPLDSAEIAGGWPMWEERILFTNLDPNADEDSALVSRAKAALTQRQNGTVTWDIAGSADGPQPGIDYAEGDTVHIQVAPQGKRDPDGGTAAVRVLGWTLDPTTLRTVPTLWPADDATSGGA